MCPAVPGHVHKADKVTAPACTNPTQAVSSHPSEPVDLGRVISEALGVEPGDFVVLEGASPLLVDRNYRHRISLDPAPAV